MGSLFSLGNEHLELPTLVTNKSEKRFREDSENIKLRKRKIRDTLTHSGRSFNQFILLK